MTTANLSVVIANRNHARHLPRAVDAVLSQTLPPREILLIDDASTDDSLGVMEALARRSPVVRVMRNDGHRGVTETYNRGFSIARGEYILPAGADDYLLPGFVKKAMREFEAHPQAGVCLGFGSCTDGDAGPLVTNDPGWCTAPTYFPPDELCRRLWRTLPVSAIIVRRDALLAAGGYRPGLAWYSDWFAFLVVAFRTGAIHIPETLGVHVQRAKSYATNAREGPENVAILGELINLLAAKEYADVAPYFRRNGAACQFGPDLIRAAARRPDARAPNVLGLLAGFSPDEYQLMRTAPEEGVRELASVFCQPPWCDVIARRADLEAERCRLIEDVQLTRLRAAPPGVLGKIRWAGNLIRRRLRKTLGLHPAGRFRRPQGTP